MNQNILRRTFSTLSVALLLLSLVGSSIVSGRGRFVSAFVVVDKTRIVDTLTDGGGNPRRGKVTFILTKTVTTPAGIAPAGSTVSAVLNSAGQFDISVYPSTSLSPQAYYQVWYAEDGSLNRELIGVYEIPESAITITLAGHKVMNTALAAEYTFASTADAERIEEAVAEATLQDLLGISPNDNTVQKYSSSTGKFANSSITDNGTTVNVARNTTVTGNFTVTGSIMGDSYPGIENADLPATISGKTVKDPTISGQARITASTFGAYGVMPVPQPTPIADTTGATLPQLEGEVNKLKAVLRNLGFIQTPGYVPPDEPVDPVTPDSVPGLLRWYKADAMALSDSAAISSWTDSSSNAAHATQSISAYRPIFKTNQANSKPAVRFDGVDDSLAFTGHTNIRAAFVVMRHDISGSNIDLIPPAGVGDTATSHFGGDEGIQLFSGNVASPNIFFTTGYVNGVSTPQRSMSKSPLQPAVYSILTSGNVSANLIGSNRLVTFLKGDVFEIFLYSALPTDQQRAGLESYAKAKYGISVLPAVVIDGNSLTADRDVQDSLLTGAQVWTTQMQPILTAAGFGNYDWMNFARNGASIDNMLTDVALEIDPIYSASRPKNISVFWEGTNQLSTGTSGHDTYLKTVQYSQGRRTVGFKTVVLTSIKRGDWAAPYETQRQAYNTELLANCSTFATACINMDAVDFYNNTTGALGADGTPDFNDPNNTLFYTPDKLHINQLGNSVVARAVSAAIMGLP